MNTKKTTRRSPITEAIVSKVKNNFVELFLGIVFVISALLFTHFSPVLNFEVYNNTGHVLVLHLDDDEKVVKDNTLLQFTTTRYYNRPALGCDVWSHRPLYTMKLTIRANVQLWAYEFSVPSRYRNITDEYRASDLLYCDIKLQINPEGIIYILKDVDHPPISEFNTQPKGFPVMPNVKMSAMEVQI